MIYCFDWLSLIDNQYDVKVFVLKDTLKAFNNFQNKQKNVRKNVFWYIKVSIFWKCIQYTIHWGKTQMLTKFPLEKTNGTKNYLFFLLQAPTHHSFTFNLRFLYELKHKDSSIKICMGFSIFDSISFLLKFIILLNKMQGSFDFKMS